MADAHVMKSETTIQTLHTPGPWSVNGSGEIITQERTGPCSHEIVARMSAWWPNAAKGHVSQDHQRANAKVICAAPEMLAALRAIAGVNGTITVDSEFVTLPDGTQIDLGRLVA